MFRDLFGTYTQYETWIIHGLFAISILSLFTYMFLTGLVAFEGAERERLAERIMQTQERVAPLESRYFSLTEKTEVARADASFSLREPDSVMFVTRASEAREPLVTLEQ